MGLIRSYQPIWSLVDLVGKQLDSTFWLWTLQNTLPYLPQPIWQDSSRNVSWSDPIQFLANGTLPDNLYWDDTLVYRLEIRKNDGLSPPSQNDALIYVVNNYIPGTGAEPIPGQALGITDNQITNPQFATVSFLNPQTTGLTITTATTTQIAPGWVVVTTGAGTLTVTQVTYSGNVYTPKNATNASYGISLANNGFSTVTLRQRFNNNGALWTGEAICANVTASSLNPANLVLALHYSDVGPSDTTIITIPLTTANTDYTQPIPINKSTSNVPPSSAWTDFDLSFQANTTVLITSVQLLGESQSLAVSYLQTSLERQIDETFHFYQPQLNFKPIPSLLVGWDFALNPAQLGTLFTVANSNPVTATPGYTWDQTIMASAVSNINVTRSMSTSAMQITTTVNNEAFYCLQYLSGAQAMETTLSDLSVNILAASSNLSSVSIVRVYLFYSSGGGTIPSLPTTIGTLAATGVFTLTAANWNLINQINGVSNQSTINNTSAIPVDLQFNYFNGLQNYGITATSNFAIVVTCTVPVSGTTIALQSISLCPGDIPTRPAPQAADEVLRECQYYYEKSYVTGIIPGTVPATDAAFAFLTASGAAGPSLNSVFQEPFAIAYKATKRAVPNVTFYSNKNASTSAKVTYYFSYNDNLGSSGITSADVAAPDTINSAWISTATGFGIGTSNANYDVDVTKLNTVLATGLHSGIYTSANLLFHYTLDARLGIV